MEKKTIRKEIIIIVLAILLLSSIFVDLRLGDPKNIKYKYCYDNYKMFDVYGKFCCINNPRNSQEDECVFYFVKEDEHYVTEGIKRIR